MEEIMRMQENLLLIRRTVGWTASEFGDKIGVTRQTINNIESGRNKLTKTQYIAMRSVLDAEISSSPNDTEMLKTLLEVLIDNPDNYSEKSRKEITERANMMVPGILAGTASRETVSKEWMKIGALAGGAALLAAPVFALGLTVARGWLQRLVGQKAESAADNQQPPKIISDNQPAENDTATEEACSEECGEDESFSANRKTKEDEKTS